MRSVRLLVAVAALLVTVPASAGQRPRSPRPAAQPAAQPAPYFPDRFDWQHKAPQEVGMDAARLDEAVKFAVASETPGVRNMRDFLMASFGAHEPYDTPVGPIIDAAGANGLIVRHGYVVAEWGDPRHVEMTHSVTKTFLTTVVGLAWQNRLIRDVDDLVREYMPPTVDLFDAPHNQSIRWDHLLRQTSDWQGTLWGKADWADRPEGAKPSDWPHRKLWDPGTHFKYNDVRVNVMALAALQVWRRPLPQVLRELVMDPIGASSTWRWNGYENSWIEIDGQRVQSVSGGGHWGGGMFINAYDMARFGYLFLRNGKWGDRQVVSPEWIRMARTPGTDNRNYGFANWYLNTGRKPLTNAPETVFYFVGNGSNIVYVDQEHDIVAVVRWIRGTRELDEFLGKLLGSIVETH